MGKATDTAATEPLLDLDTLTFRETIAIDGTRYELLNPEELSVVQSHRLGVWGRRIEELAQSADEEAGKELEELVDQVVHAAVVDCPEEVLAKLSGGHRMAIADVFTGLLLRNKLGVAGAIATAMGVKADTPTGAMPFHGSNASTAATRAPGWMRSLRRFFGRT